MRHLPAPATHSAYITLRSDSPERKGICSLLPPGLGKLNARYCPRFLFFSGRLSLHCQIDNHFFSSFSKQTNPAPRTKVPQITQVHTTAPQIIAPQTKTSQTIAYHITASQITAPQTTTLQIRAPQTRLSLIFVLSFREARSNDFRGNEGRGAGFLCSSYRGFKLFRSVYRDQDSFSFPSEDYFFFFECLVRISRLEFSN